jgi:hypothetical protein
LLQFLLEPLKFSPDLREKFIRKSKLVTLWTLCMHNMLCKALVIVGFVRLLVFFIIIILLCCLLHGTLNILKVFLGFCSTSRYLVVLRWLWSPYISTSRKVMIALHYAPTNISLKVFLGPCSIFPTQTSIGFISNGCHRLDEFKLVCHVTYKSKIETYLVLVLSRNEASV